MTHFEANPELRQLAHRISNEATQAGAGRVVFRTTTEFVFSKTDHLSVSQTLTTAGLRKYKLQRKVDDRWIDIQKYHALKPRSLIVNPRKLINQFGSGNIASVREVSTDAIAQAAVADPQHYAGALRGLHRQIFLEFGKKRTSSLLRPTLDLLDELSTKLEDPHTHYLHATLDLYKLIDSQFGFSKLDSNSNYSGLISTVCERIESYQKGHIAAQIAAAGMLGKLTSLFDRATAAQHFQTVKTLDNYGLLDHFYLDRGAHTYFDSSEFPTDVRADAQRIRNSIQTLTAQPTSNSFGLLVSVDAKFFRVYGPQLFFYAQHLPDIDFNILICGSTEEALGLIKDGSSFQSGLQTLSRIKPPKNIRYYQVPVPSYVHEYATFYASARFFASQLMLKNYEHTYLMDADLSTDVDPRPYFKRVSKISFGAPQMSDFFALHPWRRYMAGNITLNQSVLKTNAITDLQEYLAYGLRTEKSWTLDQNALSYSIERNATAFRAINSMKRPFYQNKFRLVWEKGYEP